MSDSRQSESSDDEDDRCQLLTNADYSYKQSSSYLPHDTSSSSDSDDLEVVEAGTPLSSSFETNNYQDESPYRTSNFYSQPYDSDKNEQEEPSYSLDDPPNNYNDFDPSFNESSSTKKHSTKKKSSSSKNSHTSNQVKSKKDHKRKHDNDEFDLNTSSKKKKKRKKSSDALPHNNKKSSKITHHKQEISESSSNSDTDGNEDYKSSYSNFNSPPYPNTLQSKSLAILDDEDFSETTGKHNSQKKNKDRNSFHKASLKTPLESSNKGNLLMEKMGYRAGEGLGKNAQGRVEPVELSNQKGRRGLGLTLPGLDNETVEWDPSLEEVHEREAIDWLVNYNVDALDCEMMVESWLVEGPKDLDIENMTEFIDKEILSNILKKKTVFDKLTEEEVSRTVLRSNPFETLRKGIFMNRAALKMANMDSAFDFMFTDPKDKNMKSILEDNELLYFADVCAGPGGFSEYVLWRKKWRAKGIGFTLKGDCDFKIQDFCAGPSETFEPYYGANDDGNIYNPENIESLTDFVMKVTKNKGVHFMMADGGFSVKGKENIQELLSKQLYLCQFLVALSIVREKGHFICKLFDLFSPFSVGLVFLLYRSFDEICIFKPNTSRPANSERYIVCKHRRTDVSEIRQYLFHINSRLWDLGSDSDHDVIECVPISIIKDDITFFHYVMDSNNRFGNKQMVNLDKVAAFFQNPNLRETNQNDLRKKCLVLWDVPLGPRMTNATDINEATRTIIKSVLNDRFKPDNVSGILNLKGVKLTSENFRDIFKFSILDYDVFPLGSEKLVFILGLGRNRVYKWSGTKWEPEDKLNIVLPPGTLLYGEFVPEYKGDFARQKKVMAFHIIDGLSICYEVISNCHYHKRLNILSLFTTSLKKWNNNSQCPIRVKSRTGLKHIQDIFRQMQVRVMKSGSSENCLECKEDDYLLQMKGICFIRTTREPWRKHFSRTSGNYYYYNSINKSSVYECQRPKDADATTIDSIKNQVLWIWESGVGFKGEGRVPEVLHRDDLLEFIHKTS